MAHTNTGLGQRGSNTVRLTDRSYHAQLAHRSINHDWPETMQRLWYAAHNAESTYHELESAWQHDTFHSMRLAQLVEAAYYHWQGIEQYAAPIVAAMEGRQ